MLIFADWQIVKDNLDVAIVGYVVVFGVLGLTYLIFSNLSKVLDKITRAKLRKQGKTDMAEKDTLLVTGAEAAAIATAIHMYFDEMHDEESNVITIKKVSRTYSPWSSKLHSMRTMPNGR